MQRTKYILGFLCLFLISGCGESPKKEKKGLQVNEISEDGAGKKIVGLPIDSLNLETKPRNVLLTHNPAHRLVPMYKVNYNPRTHKPYTGSNRFHSYWKEYGDTHGNNWNNNFMPGFEAMFGHNLVNVSHFNNQTKEENLFFDQPVLIKTLYYPAFSYDTLLSKPVHRKFYMISVYDEDTNGDGYINAKDLRRLYHFDIQGKNPSPLVPANYAVMSSEYDPQNDFMYVFARLDENQNGQMEYEESTHIFWIDLANPSNNGLLLGKE